MEQQEILRGLAEIVEAVTGVPAAQVQPDTWFVDDLDVGSLSMIEIVVGVEQRFGIRIPDEDLKVLGTVADAVAYLHRAGVPA
jgi:acyl carrier protein